MIGPTKNFVLKYLMLYPTPGKVLDVGSLDVNGNIRDMFPGWEYVGVDMREGKNVDVVMNGHDLSKNFGCEFDMVVCFDTLEHDNKFWLTLDEMKKVLKPGGCLMIGAPSLNHGRHDHPSDYYRFFGNAFKEVFFEDMLDVQVEEQMYGDQGSAKPDQVYGWGRKK